MLRLYVSLCVTIGVVTCQRTTVGNFSCDRALELVTRTTETGSVQSPCYDGSATNYPEELSGFKLINITYDSPYVVGYQLTVRDFDLALSDRLFIGQTTRVDGTSTLATRNLTLRSNGTANLANVRQNDDGVIIATLITNGSNTYLLEDYKTIIMDFYTTTDTIKGKGFLIDYAADIDKCMMTGDDKYCKNNGVCTRTGFNTANCNCTGTGYEGTTCETDIDECATNTDDCDVNADCTNNNGSFDCVCKTGYTGDEKNCANIDECMDPNVCNDTGTCDDSEGSFDCICDAGYTGGIGGPCTDIDECEIGNDACHANATCTDSIGSYTCACNTGFTGNGENCTDIDECATNTDDCDDDARATCTNNNGSFACECKSGYSGDGKTCNNINECSEGGHDCHSNATCTDIDGSWSCACDTGFTGNGTSCDDIDECTLGSDGCHINANCTNNDGSYKCTCKDGYTGDGKTCTDVDECAAGTDTCHNNADCTDTDGSYTCKCKTGFTGDGFSCPDINECDAETDTCHDDADCTNNNGSYTCKCKSGFTGDGRSCENIDECTTGTATCGLNTDCTDNNGSYECACKPGFTGDANVNCTDIDECDISTPCNLAETSCVNTVGSYQCVCAYPAFRGSPGNCIYYCEHNSSCLANREGFLDVPTNWTGTTKYATFDETFYNFSGVSNATVHGGIRFIIMAFDTELFDDFLSIYPGNVRDLSKEIVGISGAIGNIYNVKQRVVGPSVDIGNPDSGVTALFNQSGEYPTLTLSTSLINMVFTSDRLNASTGFLMKFEYDKDDCDGVTSCVNATGCIDGIFAYQCNCTSGFEGIDCDTDIDECNLAMPPCDGNATCNNTVGSYKCECNQYFFGDGTACKPHLVLSEYSVKKTTSSLSITFDITAPWRTTEFLVLFTIVVEGPSYRQVYENVTLSELITGDGYVVSDLSPYTPYNVTVTVQETGPLYSTAEFENTLGTRTFYTEQQAAGVPKNLIAGSGTRDRVTITWEKPDEIGFGVVTSYELCYQPASDSKTQQIVALRNIPTKPKCFIIDDTYTSYTWVGLPSYLSLSFMIRANSVAGEGNYTSMQMDYTGSACPEWTSYATRAPCPLMQGLLESTGFPQDTVNSSLEVLTQEWSHDLTSYSGWRPNFLYFGIVNQESTLDAGYGDYDISDHDVEKALRLYTYTGSISSGPNPVEGYPKNSSIPDQNTVWFAFISDRIRKGSGFQVEIEVDGNNCDSSPCLNGGACTDKLYGYDCTCTPEWTGDSCETPRVKPVVTCTPDKRKTDISFTIPAASGIERGIDETIIGGYTITISPTGSGASTMQNAIGQTTTSFSGLIPYTDYTINVTVSPSNRSVDLVPGTTTCKTLEDVPTEPQNVMVTPGDQSLDVTWEAPAQPNGVVTYIVTAMSTDHDYYGETLDTKTSADLTATSYKVESLRVYRNYSVVVQAKTSAGSKDASAKSARTDAGPPRVITGKVTVLTSTSARVEWEFDAGSYPGPAVISITATSGTHNPATVTAAETDTPYILTLEEGFNYTVTVTASTGVGTDTSFTVININTNETAPGKPATFTYDRDTSTFSWTAPTLLEQNGDITGYVLKSANSVPNFTSPEKFDASTFTYQLSGLPPFTSYAFTLQAINSVGEGMEFSLNILTKEDVPQAVASIVLDEVTATQIKISWTAQNPPVGEVIYEIVYTDGTTTPLPITTASTSYTLTGLTPYTEYTITITATTNAGKASPFTTKIMTAEDVPSVPSNLVAIFNVATYSIKVTWDAPATPNGKITQYTVSSPGKSAIVKDTEPREHVITEVVLSNTTYTITVTARTSAGEGPASTTGVTTPVIVPDAPTNLEVTAGTTTARITATVPSNTGPGLVTVMRYIVTLSIDRDDCTSKGDSSCRSNDTANSFTSFPYDITGLLAYRKYIITLAAESEGGVGASTTAIEFTTLPGAPGTPTIQVIPVPGGFDVVFTTSRPYTGPANYTATATPASGTPISNTVGPIDSPGPITVELRNLPGDAEYSITGQAQNDQGISAVTEATPVTSTPNAPTATVAATADGEITVTIQPAATVISYTITYVKVGCPSCTSVSKVITVNVRTITSLEPYTNYSISVFATSSAGDGVTVTLYQRSQSGTPRLRDSAYMPPLSNNTLGMNTAYTARLVNLCVDKNKTFDESEGPITQVAHFVRQSGSTQLVNVSFSVFYNDVAGENPKPVYRAITVNCNNARRQKRQATSGDVEIGSIENCPAGSSECNGRLDPETTYTFEACALNENGRFVCTNPSAAYTTGPAPPTGLTGGEIAAIVICSLLLLVLLVLIVIYCWKKRNQSGKARISKKGTANPVFEDKGSQRYQVDPAAAPRTEYTDAPTA